MGYRSEVAYIIKFETFEQRDTYANLKLALVPDDPEHQAMLECDYESKRRPIITFKAADVKWYDNFSDVMAHNRLMENVRDTFETAQWRFVRVGEDADDIEERGEYDAGELYEDLYVSRNIETTF